MFSGNLKFSKILRTRCTFTSHRHGWDQLGNNVRYEFI